MSTTSCRQYLDPFQAMFLSILANLTKNTCKSAAWPGLRCTTTVLSAGRQLLLVMLTVAESLSLCRGYTTASLRLRCIRLQLIACKMAMMPGIVLNTNSCITGKVLRSLSQDVTSFGNKTLHNTKNST